MNASLLGNRKVLVAHPRRHHLHHTAVAYQQAKRLAGFLTSVYVARPRRLDSIARLPLGRVAMAARKLTEYHCPRLQADNVLISPDGLLAKLTMRCLGGVRFIEREGSIAGLAGKLCAEHGWVCHMPCLHAVEAFETCHGAGAPCVLEQYIGHRREGRDLMQIEHERWGIPFDAHAAEHLGFSPARIDSNDRELELAAAVIVGSPFVAQTLKNQGVPAARIHIAQYGVELNHYRPQFNQRHESEPLQIAFVGQVGLRKGILYLLQAVKQLGEQVAHVHVYGQLMLPGKLLEPFEKYMTAHGHVPRSTLVDRMANCHAFALPSLWEGSSYAVYEAMAMGKPAIVTANTGSVITDGVDGFVVPIRSADAIAEAILAFREEARRQALATAAAENVRRYDWPTYGRAMLKGLGIGDGGKRHPAID